MYKLLCLTFICLFAYSKENNLSAQNYTWAKSFGSAVYEHSSAICVDAAGNVYVAGAISDTVDFDPDPNASTIRNGSALFIAKYDVMGNFISVFIIPTLSSSSDVKSMRFDHNNDLVVIGNHSSGTDFNQGSGNAILNTSGYFLAKYSSTGTFIWVKDISTDYSLNPLANHFHIDGSDNIYITGVADTAVDFDPSNGVTKLSAMSVFFAKYDSNGSLLLLKGLPTDSRASAGSDIKTDNTGNIFVTLKNRGVTDVDPGVNVVNLTGTGGVNDDIILAKYNSAGDYIWSFQIGADGDEGFSQIQVDDNGAVYLAGRFESHSWVGSTVYFNPPFNTSYLISNSSDIFFAKYDESGVFQWVKQITGSATEELASFEIKNNYLFLTGFYSFSVDLDPGPQTSVQPALGVMNLFVGIYDPDGDYVFSMGLSSTGNQKATDIATDFSSNFYITGMFNTTLDFDPGPASATLVSNGSDDVFLAKYSVPSVFTSEIDKETVIVFPNPANENIVITAPEIHIGSELLVLDIKGDKKIHKFATEDMRIPINIRNLSPGFYIIQLRSNGRNYFQKFVKD